VAVGDHGYDVTCIVQFEDVDLTPRGVVYIF
jgi:hypothetical protein